MSVLSDAWDRNIGNRTGMSFGSLFNPFDRSNSIGNVLEGGWNMMSGQATAQKQLELYNDQLALSKEQLYKGHQIEVQDLINAGLNPVLSAQGEGNSTTLPGIPNLSGLYGEGAFDKLMSVWGQTNQTRTTNSAINLNNSQAALNNANALKAQSESGLFDKQTLEAEASAQLKQQETENRKKDMEILQNELEMYNDKKEKLRQEIKLLKEEIKNQPPGRKKTESETKLNEVKTELWQVTKVAGIVASTMTGITAGIGGITKLKNLVDLIKGGTKIVGFIPK